ncbi:hypothetical protein NDU88_003165 [Pleurodeles waltl]|uniref:Uncharacterized protein n=1 Tax=Pleurodeles waltl TaxID=8319 RepID=A0AAV7WN98_PLEWA|nr:hypothetical protein NDU88_003165 [Pleurodeles waltl]
MDKKVGVGITGEEGEWRGASRRGRGTRRRSERMRGLRGEYPRPEDLGNRRVVFPRLGNRGRRSSQRRQE